MSCFFLEALTHILNCQCQQTIPRTIPISDVKVNTGDTFLFEFVTVEKVKKKNGCDRKQKCCNNENKTVKILEH